MPVWINTIFGTSAITPCAVMAIVLNLLMPPEPIEENEALKAADSGDHEAEGDGEAEAAEA
jgi:NCS2 family nucleobase:cation symporter-2